MPKDITSPVKIDTNLEGYTITLTSSYKCDKAALKRRKAELEAELVEIKKALGE
jgi:hypothetical protein